MFAVNEAAALAVLKPLPLKPLLALPQLTPEPLDQLEKVTPVGGVVQVAVGVAGQVIVAPPPTVTTVCPVISETLHTNASTKRNDAFVKLLFGPSNILSSSFFISGIVFSQILAVWDSDSNSASKQNYIKSTLLKALNELLRIF
ncbi:hypothetical protein [Flavobacterium sp.]|uniref:hypothetical protein n=1 Tax=Flavobacterium sp. TaxID=239 RepID=UPI0039E42E88